MGFSRDPQGQTRPPYEGKRLDPYKLPIFDLPKDMGVPWYGFPAYLPFSGVPGSILRSVVSMQVPMVCARVVTKKSMAGAERNLSRCKGEGGKGKGANKHTRGSE